MAIWAISDLHLPGGDIKPMDVFGPHWIGHFDRIRADWLDKVDGEDIVLLPGDLSWAMTLRDALDDIVRIGALPGKKIILRGNHDYWWSAIGRVRDALPEGMYALQNDGLSLNGALFAGSRLWTLPGEGVSADDTKIYRREVMRLEMSLRDARRRDETAPIICMTHYPPLTESNRDTECTALFEKYGVSDVAYGHLHGPSLKNAFRGEHNGVMYHQVSCDGLDFKLYLISASNS